MKEVSMNKDMKLSEHFTLGELTKTSYKTEDGNIPSRVAIENLKNLCENWLEDIIRCILGTIPKMWFDRLTNRRNGP